MAGTVSTAAAVPFIIEQLESHKGLISVATVAKLLGESTDTIYRRTKRGKMPHVRIGISTKFDPRELAAWIREHHFG
jgi:excisionase family DNA binding protein